MRFTAWVRSHIRRAGLLRARYQMPSVGSKSPLGVGSAITFNPVVLRPGAEPAVSNLYVQLVSGWVESIRIYCQALTRGPNPVTPQLKTSTRSTFFTLPA